MKIERDVAVEASRRAAIQAYRKFLDAAPKDRLRPEAMRRVGDLGIEQAQEGAENADARQYKDAIQVYQDLLRAYPRHDGNDRVLYQLAHAYDQIGDLPNALATLDRLFAQYPNSDYHSEAAFRRGELLFAMRRYDDAQLAYESVLRSGQAPAFHERALYMHGWSLFKQLQLVQGLHSFFAVLDRKLIGRDSDAALEEVPGLTRAERELVEDSFRVVSLSFANLRGAESIPPYFQTPGREQYEFRVYRELGELFLKQERVEDAADALNAFVRRHPTHVQAPILQSRVIEAYQQAGFAALALETKKEFVVRYGTTSEFRRVNDPIVYERVLPYVKTHLEELARHYHATAQKNKKSEDYQEAVRWYRAFLDSFPTDARAPGMHFLLGELLFEDKRYAQAAAEYERSAYDYPHHAKSADAGYAALLAYAQQEKLAKDDETLVVKRRAVESAIRFADANPKDARNAGVLTDTAEKLFAVHDQKSAIVIAQRVLALDPPATAEQRRTAWTVVAHVEFQQGSFDRAERGYRETLALTPEKSPNHASLTERLAASVYKQGEQARSTGQLGVAAAHFLRVGKIMPNSPIRATAEYDAAAVLIAQKDWNGAAKVLEDFRRDHPKHALQAEIPGKLALVYLESGQALKAAAEFETLAATKGDTGLSREALWQAAELYEKAGHERNAAVAYERYARQHTRPLEAAIEARYRLAEMSRKQGQSAKRQAWSRELVEMEQKGGGERTDRTRYLGAMSAMVMAEP
ncbi:MAG TPA: tetratricopeptide repeat protein, partial [Burkholderiales bacterium]|nr:tetratricopeptide repeat protein [Burkholderiales bacterium]